MLKNESYFRDLLSLSLNRKRNEKLIISFVSNLENHCKPTDESRN